jgi:hypothetical protein
MKKTNIVLVAAALLTAPFSQAAWESVNNFDSGSTAGITVARSNDEPTNGGITIIADPNDATKGILEMDPGMFGGDGTQTHNVWFSIPFGDISGTGTLYAKMKRGELVDVVWGTSPTAEPTSYGDYSAALRWELDGIFDWREGSEGYPEVTNGASSADTWYHTWFVLNSTNQTYDVYIQGGTEFPTRTQVADDAAFRKQGTDPQNRFYVRMSTGDISNPKSVDKVWVDDVAVDTSGENLAIPGDDIVVEKGPGVVPTENGSGLLSNLSTRGQVSSGENAMFVGFVVPDASRRVLIRGGGPILGGFGVNGFLANPVITVRNSANEVVATNTNWEDNANSNDIIVTAAAVGAQPFTAGSADAALMLFLAKGAYTVEVTSGDSSTGVVIAEIYRIP